MTLQLLNEFPYKLNAKYSVKLDMVGSGDGHKETQLQNNYCQIRLLYIDLHSL